MLQVQPFLTIKINIFTGGGVQILLPKIQKSQLFQNDSFEFFLLPTQIFIEQNSISFYFISLVDLLSLNLYLNTLSHQIICIIYKNQKMIRFALVIVLSVSVCMAAPCSFSAAFHTGNLIGPSIGQWAQCDQELMCSMTQYDTTTFQLFMECSITKTITAWYYPLYSCTSNLGANFRLAGTCNNGAINIYSNEGDLYVGGQIGSKWMASGKRGTLYFWS